MVRGRAFARDRFRYRSEFQPKGNLLTLPENDRVSVSRTLRFNGVEGVAGLVGIATVERDA
jgi:hypothetical protein